MVVGRSSFVVVTTISVRLDVNQWGKDSGGGLALAGVCWPFGSLAGKGCYASCSVEGWASSPVPRPQL